MSTLFSSRTKHGLPTASRWRRWVARRRATRGDHVAALRLSRDAAVLSQLGLHLAVLEATQTDVAAHTGLRALAHAELGDPGPALSMIGGAHGRLHPMERQRLLLAAGRWDPAAALAHSDGGPVAVRAALAAHCQKWDTAAAVLRASGSDPKDANEAFLRASVAAQFGDHREARRLVHAAFKFCGLAPPLSIAPQQIKLDSLAAGEPLVRADADGPRVSVIMPVKSMGSSVEIAARSVLAQRGVQVELIVVDDASEDDTAVRVDAMAGHEPRLRLLRRNVAAGTYAARNIGLAAATAPFVAFNDADDWSHPERLRRQLQPLLVDPRMIATESRLVRLDMAGRFVAPRVYPLIRANRSSLVFRRAALDKLGGFQEVRFGADEEFAARIIACFGVKALGRLRLPLTIGLQTVSSLTGSQRTGIMSQEGVRARIAYRETWMSHHLAIAGAVGPDWRAPKKGG